MKLYDQYSACVARLLLDCTCVKLSDHLFCFRTYIIYITFISILVEVKYFVRRI
jgi:hypothetical protein